MKLIHTQNIKTFVFLILSIFALIALNFFNAPEKTLISKDAVKLPVTTTLDSEIMVEGEQEKIEASQIKDIAQTDEVMFVLTKDGRLFSRGSNTYGLQAKTNSGETQKNLQVIKFPNDIKISQISFTDHHILALSDSGDVWAWGGNISGQIGNNTRINQSKPQKVLTNASKIAAGYRFSAAIKKNGELWAWGMNCDQNQPGLKQLTESFANDLSVGGSYYDGPDDTDINACLNEQNLPIASIVPRHLPFSEKFSEVAAGYGHLLMIDQSQKAWGFGCNGWGQLGRGHNQNNNGTRIITAVSFPEGVKIAKIDAGFRHSIALDTSGKLWSWGIDSTFEPDGYGSNRTDSPRMVDITGNISSIEARHDYSGLMIDGNLYVNTTADPVYSKIVKNISGFSLGRSWQTYWTNQE